jgi:predicted transcriptional regulator
MSESSFYFDVNAEGAAVFLGPTEAELMELAWQKNELTVKKALYFLGENKERSYTTLMTILARLADKGLLLRERQGRSFVYRPAVDRKAFLRERVRRVTGCIDRNFPNVK